MTNEAMTLQSWIETRFKPWQAEVDAYRKEEEDRLARLKANMPQLEAIVGLLMDGRTRAAVLAWNTLGIHPELKDIKMSDDGRTLICVDVAGNVVTLTVEGLEKALQGLEKQTAGRA